jgi:hypothetical protein
MPLNKIKINQEGLKLSGAHQHVVGADDINDCMETSILQRNA